MKKIDWQLFEAGQMTGDQLAEAQEALKNDPQAAKELDGLKNFTKTCRKAGLSEPVPTQKLNAICSQVCQYERAPLWRRLAVPAAAAAVVFVVVFMATRGSGIDPLAPVPPGEQLLTGDSLLVADWASQRAHIFVPKLDLAKVASLKSAECGEGWACLDMTAESQKYQLWVYRKDECLAKLKEVQDAGMKFYVGDGLAWRCPKSVYWLRGGTEASRKKIAMEICKQLGLVEINQV